MVEVSIPHLGESIQQARIIKWHAKEGDVVRKNQVIAEIETEKITLEIYSPHEGHVFHIKKKEGSFVKVSEVIAIIDKVFFDNIDSSGAVDEEETTEQTDQAFFINEKEQKKGDEFFSQTLMDMKQVENDEKLSESKIIKGKIRKPLSDLRKTISKNLKRIQNEAAVLTTFNEINMENIVGVRSKYNKNIDTKEYKLSILPFFIKAVFYALEKIPVLNSYIEDEEIVMHTDYSVNIAISTNFGLITPCIQKIDQMSIVQINDKIQEFSKKANNKQLTLDDVNPGSMTITNGGVFGSMLSTPLLSPMQSCVLGLHKITDRVIVKNGHMCIAPIMYVALSYDHRLIDGKDSISFLNAIKDYIEHIGFFYLNS